MYFSFFISKSPITRNKSYMPVLENKHSDTGGLFVMILVSELFPRWEGAPALSQAELCSCWCWLELEEALLFILMCFKRVISGITFCKGLACSALVEHPALSARLCWGPRYFCAGVLVPLQLSVAIVLPVLLCDSYVLTPQDIEASVVTVWWKTAMTGSYIYLRFI